MYKLSNDAIELISSVIKDFGKKDYKISTKQEMEEFCFGLALVSMGLSDKIEDKEKQKEVLSKINLTVEEIQKHIEEIDYADLNQRIKL